MKRVLVGISGGVDSSVTAHLLRSQGYHVEGILLKQVNEPVDCDDYVCCAESAIALARSVCDQIGITLHTQDVRSIFDRKVIQPSISVWEGGGVPSPCTTCNADVRGPLFDYYRQVLQCDYFATGHYFINEGGQIRRGVDERKDQSYMVSLVDRRIFNHWLTPLGPLTKSSVREIAREANIPTADTPDSQNLCFNHLLPSFDRPVFKEKGGELVQIARHNGRPAVGQRKGFGGDTVVAVERDRIMVGAAATPKSRLDVKWRTAPGATENLVAQTAYHGKKYPVLEVGTTHITLADRAIVNAGQVVAVYSDDILVGGGIIQ